MIINKNKIIFIKLIMRYIFNQLDPKPTFRFILIINKLLKQNGTLYTIKYMKWSRLAVTRYLCGKPLKVTERVSLDKSGFPSKFYFLRKFVDSASLLETKFVLSLFNISKSIIPRKDEIIPIDYSSISDSYKGKKYYIPHSFMINWIKINSLKGSVPCYSNTQMYLSNKGSPSGPALYAMYHNLLLWSYGLLDKALKLIKLDLDSDEKILIRNYNYAWNNYTNSNLKSKIGVIGKLAVIRDPECKMRIIAMVDYFSQLLLRPIHNELLLNLKKLDCDRTFTQNPYHPWKDDGNYFYSLDLSSATDRFPIFLQYNLIKLLFDSEVLADSWKFILINRSYMTPKGRLLNYSVGQPMGAYSSWAAFSLTHHLVVAWAAHLCGLSNFKDYIILGDDIVIKNNIVARKYITLMTRWGVDISKHKTHMSSNTYEFCKRWIRLSGKRYIELSGLPLKGILLNYKSSKVVYSILLDYILKGNIWTFSGKLLELISLLYKNPVINRVLYNFDFAMRYSHNLVNYEEIRTWLCKNSPDWYQIAGQGEVYSEMNRVLSKGLVKMAYDSSIKTINIYNNLIAYYKTCGLTDLHQLKSSPLVNGIYNHLLDLKMKTDKIEQVDSVNLLDFISSFTFINVDQLVAFRRNLKTLPIVIDRLFKNSSIALQSISIDDEIIYGSWSGGSTYDDIGFTISLRYNQVEALNSLKRILDSDKEIPCLTTMEELELRSRETISSWENFRID